MAKGILKSIRISEDVLEIIEAQPGDTFTAKLEGMIRTCHQEMAVKQAELKAIQKTISREHDRLRQIRDKNNKLERTISDLTYSMTTISTQTKRATSALAELIGEDEQ